MTMDLEEASDQEVYDFVITHLRQQGRPAKHDLHDCAYRGGNNTKCAVGCLIPDELYDPSFEGSNVYGARLRDLFPATRLDFLRQLQLLHDNKDNWTEDGIDEKAVKLLAASLGLTYTPRKEPENATQTAD